MKLTTTIKMLLLLLWLPFTIKAQVAPELAQKFPANIITRIYGVTAKVKLPIEEQIQLGNLFKKQDSLANAAIARGATPTEVNKYYITRPETLAGILTPLELNDYTIGKDNAASKFAVAIKYREQLALNKTQVDSLFLNLNIIKTGRKKSGAEIKKQEIEHLTKVLNNEQYRSLLFILNKGKALTYATNAWQQLKQTGLTTGLDSAKETAVMCNYQNNKITAADYTNATGNVDKSNAANTKPLLLQKLDVINGNVAEKELAAAIKYRTELNLNTSQVNTMVNYAIQLENWRNNIKVRNANVKPDSKKNELALLFKVLKTDEQYTQFLNLKNADRAAKNAQDDWVELQKFDLNKGLDSIQTNTQNLKYETNLLVSVERMANSNTPEKADSVKKAIEANRSKILLKLAAYKKTLPKSQFADVINYRKELTLDDSQIDQLLENSSKEEFLKLDNKAHNLYVLTKTREFEGKNLVAILNQIQYANYLFYKVNEKARDNAQKDWVRLKQSGIAKGLDSAKVHIETINYETNMLVALERIKNENSQKNVFFKKDMENKKPVYLKQLDMAVKNLAANDDAKKNLTW